MKARACIAVQGFVTLTCAFALMGSPAQADPGDISALGGGNDYCVTETGTDPDGNANGCIDGKGLGGGISALQVSPDGKRLYVLGFDTFNNFSGTGAGDSITTYDISASRGSLTVDPRDSACRSSFTTSDCSTAVSYTHLTLPTILRV